MLSRTAGWGIGAVVRAIRVVRSPRPIHPTGVLVGGGIEPIVGRGVRSGVEWIDDPRPTRVVGRLSRGIGTPVPMPDIWGLALRLGDGASSEGADGDGDGDGDSDSDGHTHGDVLLAAVGNLGVPWRFVPVPRLSPHGVSFSTVMPYRADTGPVLIGARTLSGAPASASARGVGTELARTPWVLELLWATPRGRWRAFATVSLTATTTVGGDAPADSPAVRFDPVLSPPPGARTYGWTRALREPAYRVARRG